MIKIQNDIKQFRLVSLLTPENIILLLLILFTLFFRLLTAANIETGGDAAGVWFYAKKLLYGLPYDRWSHHAARFGMIFPVYLIQAVFGTHPVVYYITPLLFFLLQILFLYKIGLRAHSIKLAYLSSMLLIFFPQMFRHAVQIKPGGFCATYILISVYFLFKFHDSEDHPNVYVLLSSVFLFLAYLAKITSLFFLPGIVLSIWVLRKRIRYIIVFCSLLFVLFLGETAIYYLVAGFKFGRIGIIMGAHLSSGNLQPLSSFLDLFDRYTGMIGYWKIYFFAYLLSTCFLAVVAKRIEMDEKIKSLLIIPLGFFLLLTFAVKSIDPVIPAMSFNHRHLVLAAPLMMLIISYSLIVAFRSLQGALFKGRSVPSLLKGIKPVPLYALITGFLAVLSLLAFIFVLPYYPKYARDRFFYDHPFQLAFQYHRVLNHAYTSGIPIIQEKIIPRRFKERVDPVQALLRKGYTIEEACRRAGIAESDYLYSLKRVQRGDYKTFKIFTRIFWDGDFSSKENFSFPEMERVVIKNRSIGFMVRDEFKKQKDYKTRLFFNEEHTVVVMLEKPFRVKQVRLREFLN